MRRNPIRLMLVSIVLNGLLCAQAPAPPQAGATAAQGQPASGSQLDQLRPNYVLRPGDQILIRAFELEEISERPFRVDGDGFVDLPVLGRVKAGGLSVEEFEKALVELAKKYVQQPQITVTVVQFSSEPVFFVGAFRTPGIYPLAGSRTLVEMMSSVGGLQPTASRRIKITRRKEYGAIPLPNAITLPDGSGTSVEISMASLRDSVNPAEDIVLKPFDVISVERAEMVYVTGDVGHIGAFELQERDSMSVMQALTMAGGLGQTADPKKLWILRPVSNTSLRAAVPLNLQRILKGEDNDKPLLPNDILYVPRSSFTSRNLGRTLLVALPSTLG
ncbi:MAG: polysaccharide biosynthesis/export family protein, partial [Bryobacteraceae bacterium]